jgi:hypothetical protein
MPLLRVLAGPDPSDPVCVQMELGDPATVDVRDLTVYVAPHNARFRARGVMMQAVEDAARALERRGARVVPFDVTKLRRGLEYWAGALAESAEESYDELLASGTGRARIGVPLELLKAAAGRSNHTLPALVVAAAGSIVQRFGGATSGFARAAAELRAELAALLGDPRRAPAPAVHAASASPPRCVGHPLRSSVHRDLQRDGDARHRRADRLRPPRLTRRGAGDRGARKRSRRGERRSGARGSLRRMDARDPARIRLVTPQVFGEYLLTSRLVERSMAEVFLGVRLGDRTGRLIVVKRAPLDESASGAVAESIRREIEVLSSGPTKAWSRWSITARSPGCRSSRSSTRRVARSTTSSKQVRSIATPRMLVGRDLARAIASLHAGGWVHGDVTPSNVVIDDTGEALLVDLGIARRLGEAREMPAGKPGYASPEAAVGKPASPSDDVYAWGIVVAECLIGGRLFREADLAEAAARRSSLPLPVEEAPLLAAALGLEPASRPEASALVAGISADASKRRVLADAAFVCGAARRCGRPAQVLSRPWPCGHGERPGDRPHGPSQQRAPRGAQRDPEGAPARRLRCSDARAGAGVRGRPAVGPPRPRRVGEPPRSCPRAPR